VKKKKTYNKEFKREAVKLVLEQEMTCTQVAKDLGVAYGSVAKWVRDYTASGNHAFPGKGKLLPWDEEKRELERKLKRAETERDILKKTIAYFAERP
jgi:transposase